MADDPEVDGALSDEPTGDAPGDTPAGVPEPVAPAEELPFDPDALTPELRAQWKKMQAAHTVRSQKVAAQQNKIALVDKFRADQSFARQVIQAEAQRLGLSLGTGTAPPSGEPSPTAPPRELTEAMERQLSPEMKWMAPQMAAAYWAGHQLTTLPLAQRTEQAAQEAKLAQSSALLEQLSELAPGWEAHEDDMAALLDFIKSDALTHPVFGSKAHVLYQAVTGNARAVKEATRRMSDAGRQRSTTGQPGRSSVPNITEQVRNAKSTTEAFDIAARHAVEQLKRQGVTV